VYYKNREFIILFATHGLIVAFHLKMSKKQQFLSEHNKLSPVNLQATTSLLSRFRIERASLFKEKNWSIEKMRRPFILWLTSLTLKEKEDINKKEKTKVV
jgi:hypothetical protein